VARITSALSAFAIGGLVAAPAIAQPAESVMSDFVRDWLVEGAVGYSELTIDYGHECILPAVLDLDEESQQVFVVAGGFEAGLDPLYEADPTGWERLLPQIEQCAQTMILGEGVIPWVNEELPDSPQEERDRVAVCVMDAVRPLPSVAKQVIALADSFEQGVEELLAEPDLAGTVEEDIESCV